MVRLRYPELAPEGYAALSAFGHYINTGTALEPVLLGLVYLRASVLNGCQFCIELHREELRKHHEPESRIEAVERGPQSDAFTPREQAALQWTTTLTWLNGAEVPDEAYQAISRFFHEKELVDLTFAIANINAWNRMGVAFQPHWRPKTAQPQPAEGPGSSPHTGVPTEVDQAYASASPSPSTQDDEGKVAFD